MVPNLVSNPRVLSKWALVLIYQILLILAKLSSAPFVLEYLIECYLTVVEC
jgi:hypothetical protein